MVATTPAIHSTEALMDFPYSRELISSNSYT